MARNGAIAPARRLGYFDRRSALELAVIDLLAIAGVLLIAVPGAANLRPATLGVLLGLAPALVLVTGSLRSAALVPGVLALDQLDPSFDPPPEPHLASARRLARLGCVAAAPFLALAVAVELATALLP